MDINQQQHLANFAPKPSLDKYSKGADPRVISGIVALSEMQEQAAMRQRANLASGAASGQMPTVRDKIMSLFQQSNPQQAQMQPNPMQQGIAARAHPNLQTAPMPEKYAQEAPQEAPEEMYSGGVARLPVRDDMFGYAGGGIIAFKNEGSVPEPDDTLPARDAEGSRKRMKQRTDMTPEKMDVTDLDFMSLPELEKSEVLAREMAKIPKEEPPVARPATSPATPREPYAGPRHYDLYQQGAAWNARKQAAREAERNAPPAPSMTKEELDKKRTEFREGVASLLAGSGTQGVKEPIKVAAMPESRLPKQESAPPPTLMDGRPNPAYLEFIRREGSRDRGADPFAYDQSKMPMPSGGIPAALQKPTVITGEGTPPKQAPGGAPKVPAANVPGGGANKDTSAAAPAGSIADMLNKALTQPGYKPTAPKSLEALMQEDREAAAKVPTAPEALELIKHYDRMARRYEANDQEEKAQQAINARNNLWTFLTNTRGSSLGVAAGKANAALQPLLSAQETRRQTYQKQRDEQEMLLGKSRYEIAQAERARKEGRVADARKHQQEAQKAELEAAKLAEQARGNTIQGGLGALRNEETTRHHKETMANIAANREAAAQRHAENMAFNREKFGTNSDFRRQQLMQTNPAYKRATEELSQISPALTLAASQNKAPPPMIVRRVQELEALIRKFETDANIGGGSASAAPAPDRKVIDFNKIGQK